MSRKYDIFNIAFMSLTMHSNIISNYLVYSCFNSASHSPLPAELRLLTMPCSLLPHLQKREEEEGEDEEEEEEWN